MWATRLATQEAGFRHAPLQIVHIPGESVDGIDLQPRRVCSDALAVAQKTAPDVAATACVLPATGSVDDVLAAADGQLLAVGAHGWGRLGGSSIGSAIEGLVAKAAIDLLVACGGEHADGQIVLGLHGGPRRATPAAIAAFEQARWHRAELLVLRTWTQPLGTARQIPPGLREQQETLVAADALRPCRESYPPVTVHVQVRQEPPADALIQLSHTARLLVMGARQPGARDINERVVRSAQCPVLIVPAG